MFAVTDADVVIWELSLFDTLSSEDVLLLGHTTFVDIALRNHQAVVFVLPPPVADGAIPFSAGWDPVIAVANRVAAQHPGRVFIANAAAVWGTTFVGTAPDGTPLRKPDGVHICPLGAALFGTFSRDGSPTTSPECTPPTFRRGRSTGGATSVTTTLPAAATPADPSHARGPAALSSWAVVSSGLAVHR